MFCPWHVVLSNVKIGDLKIKLWFLKKRGRRGERESGRIEDV
jgi:hypothetical protein